MPKVELRNQRVSDAKRFYEMLNNPNFTYFDVCPKSIEAEREFLRLNARKRRDNIEFNYGILYGGKLIGACGLKIDQQRKFIGEIGYFVDEAYWGKSIATKAVKILEKIAFKKGLIRIEVIMDTRNKGSEKVAIKCGYKKEGRMKKSITSKDGIVDSFLYAKVK